MRATYRLLDLCCGEGGAARGYHRAGFDVTGVDSDANRGKRYPYVFIHADAVEYVKAFGHKFDAIHASPPCQRFTHGNVVGEQASKHPDLITPVREALASIDVPWVIENVPRAPLIDPITLCGTMFDLTATDDDGTVVHLQRHRLFESNVALSAPGPCRHVGVTQWAGSYGGARRDKHEARHVRRGGYVPSVTVQERLLGIDWMTQTALRQSIPPAYTRWLGGLLLARLTGRRA
jgi:DNA (cytosine-5)-methyltransferase 1